MEVNAEDLRDDYFAARSRSGAEFPWDQRTPFDSALRDELASSPDAALVSWTLAGQVVLLFISGGAATFLSASDDGVTTRYVGSLNGGLLERTVRRVDETLWVSTLRFTHERFPDGGVADTANTRRERERQDQLFELLRPFSSTA